MVVDILSINENGYVRNMIIYHHDDLDGITAAAIIYNEFKTGVYIPVNYGDMWNPEDVKDAVVYVVDFSFPDMYALKNACHTLVWVDHHKSAMDNQPAAWNDQSIEGKRSLEYSGCELIWMYFYDDPMPGIIKFVGDRDMWKFAYLQTKAITEAAAYKLKHHECFMWDELFNPKLEYKALETLYDNGVILLEAQYDRIEKAYESGKDIYFNGLKTRIVNASADISEIGQRIYTSGYDLAIVWRMVDDKAVVSFRSAANSNVLVNTIAQQFGGGGHPHAAGATLSIDKIMEWYN